MENNQKFQENLHKKKGEGQCPGKSRADYSDNTRLMDYKSKNREVNYLDRENLIDTWKNKKWSRANWKIKTNQTEEKTWAEKIGNEWITKTQEVCFLKGKERLARFNRKKNTLPWKKRKFAWKYEFLLYFLLRHWQNFISNLTSDKSIHYSSQCCDESALPFR